MRVLCKREWDLDEPYESQETCELKVQCQLEQQLDNTAVCTQGMYMEGRSGFYVAIFGDLSLKMIRFD